MQPAFLFFFFITGVGTEPKNTGSRTETDTETLILILSETGIEILKTSGFSQNFSTAIYFHLFPSIYTLVR